MRTGPKALPNPPIASIETMGNPKKTGKERAHNRGRLHILGSFKALPSLAALARLRSRADRRGTCLTQAAYSLVLKKQPEEDNGQPVLLQWSRRYVIIYLKGG